VQQVSRHKDTVALHGHDQARHQFWVLSSQFSVLSAENLFIVNPFFPRSLRSGSPTIAGFSLCQTRISKLNTPRTGTHCSDKVTHPTTYPPKKNTTTGNRVGVGGLFPRRTLIPGPSPGKFLQPTCAQHMRVPSASWAGNQEIPSATCASHRPARCPFSASRIFISFRDFILFPAHLSSASSAKCFAMCVWFSQRI